MAAGWWVDAWRSCGRRHMCTLPYHKRDSNLLSFLSLSLSLCMCRFSTTTAVKSHVTRLFVPPTADVDSLPPRPSLVNQKNEPHTHTHT